MKPAEDPPTAGGTTIEELERFRQDIERYRARRKAVSDEFEGFVQSFKKPTTAAASAPVARPAVAPAAVAPAPAPPRTAAPVPVTPAPAAPASATKVVPPVHGRVNQTTAPAPVLTPPRTEGRGGQVARALAVLVLAGLVILVAVWLWRDRGPAGDPAAQPSAAAQRTVPDAAPAAAPVRPPSPSPPDRSQAELRATRAVWIRATADGTRVVNRELPAGAQVPFRAEKTIEIRAGDAGAVRLWIGGRDQGPLGRDGEVVTRSFTVPVR